MDADILAMLGARASATIILAMLNLNNSAPTLRVNTVLQKYINEICKKKKKNTQKNQALKS